MKNAEDGNWVSESLNIITAVGKGKGPLNRHSRYYQQSWEPNSLGKGEPYQDSCLFLSKPAPQTAELQKMPWFDAGDPNIGVFPHLKFFSHSGFEAADGKLGWVN